MPCVMRKKKSQMRVTRILMPCLGLRPARFSRTPVPTHLATFSPHLLSATPDRPPPAPPVAVPPDCRAPSFSAQRFLVLSTPNASTGGDSSTPCAFTLMLTWQASFTVNSPDWLARRKHARSAPACWRSGSTRIALRATTPARPSRLCRAVGPPLCWSVSSRGTRLKTSVPLCAQDVWGLCFIIALVGIVAHHDENAWTDLLILQVFFAAPAQRKRKERHHFRRHETETLRRCQDSIKGLRKEPWDTVHTRSARKPPLCPDGRVLGRLSSQSLRWPSSGISSLMTSSWRSVGFIQRVGRPSTRVSKPCALSRPGTLLISTRTSLRKALASFPYTSGWSSSSDQWLRFLGDAVSLMFQGHLPEPLRSSICGVSIMTLRKSNGSVRPIAIGLKGFRGWQAAGVRHATVLTLTCY